MRRPTKLALARLLLIAVLSLLTAWAAAAMPEQVRPAPEARQPQVTAGSDASAGAASAEEDLLYQVLAAGKLVVATDANYPPFSFYNDDGELVGFDVDVAKEVARRLGVLVEFKTPPWDDVIAGNWDGQWDVSIGSMTPTDQRALVLWFAQPYYFWPSAFALHEDNTTIITVEDLSGKDLGIAAGTSCQAWLDGELDIEPYGGVIAYPPPAGVNVVFYEWAAQALEDLALGDGVILDAAMAGWLDIEQQIEAGSPLKFLGEPPFYEPLVFALDQARGPSDLMLEALNDIIADMRSDGKLSWISGTWLWGFDFSEPVVPSEVHFTSVYLPLAARQYVGPEGLPPVVGR